MPFYANIRGFYDDGMRKNWITPTVCIGDGWSSYEWFDVVVNANTPQNRIPHKKIGRREEQSLSSKCTLYLVGMYDADIEDVNRYVDILIPKLKVRYEQDPTTKFLFHCFAGKSRSVALALAFLVEVMNMEFEEALVLVKDRRPIVNPRPHFIETLRKRYEHENNIE